MSFTCLSSILVPAIGQYSKSLRPTASYFLRPCPFPGTQSQDECVIVPASLWEAFHRLSFYVEALCLYEWCLFTESITQNADRNITRGEVYTLLTARPDNRRPFSWERN